MSSVRQTGVCEIGTRTEDGFRVVRVANRRIAADIVPELGGRIWNLWDLERSMQWLWHSPNVPPRRVTGDASYDDNWSGGWEELFPNDAAGFFEGRQLPDHGEWWSGAWECDAAETGDGSVALRLHRAGKALRAEYEKWVVVKPESPSITVRYRITSRERAPFHCLFKQHLAVAVTPSHRLELPGGRVRRVDPSFSTLIGADSEYEWPMARDHAGRPIDLRVCRRADERHQEFIYVRDLPDGWCGVRHEPTGASLRLFFARATFPFTWFFLTYGGWRDLYTAVLEPCTNMPKDLAAAVRAGQSARCVPGAALETEVQLAVS